MRFSAVEPTSSRCLRNTEVRTLSTAAGQLVTFSMSLSFLISLFQESEVYQVEPWI
jgi:hypothetical protein